MTYVTLISGVALAFSCYMVIGLAVDAPDNLIWEICIPGAFLFGVISSRLFMTLEASNL